jgi:hypothetical protein
MITMLTNFLIQQNNSNILSCHITMKVVSEDSYCSLLGWVARVACAEVSTGSLEHLKAKHGQKGPYGPQYLRENTASPVMFGNLPI